MPQSLLDEFADRRQAGQPFGKALKNAIFQAKPVVLDLEYGEGQKKEKFKLWKIRMRDKDDDEPVDWWFASTGIPILAATLGPMANVLSIGALVTYWRVDLRDPTNTNALLPQVEGLLVPDPHWCYLINIVSLILGFIGNFFLLLNFTNRIRYIISLPMTILLWFVACALLVGDLVGMQTYTPPASTYETYSGGFWYGIAAASIYLLLSILLMANLVGYIRGHYPQHFDLTEDQRTLIVQTIFFFIWLAGGAGVYARLEGWHFIDALYYCDVTILTVGFGDLYPTENLGRALLIPFSLGGIIMLGLVVSSIYKSAQELGEKKITRGHFEHERERAMGRTVATSLELQRREVEAEMARERAMAKQAARPSSRSPATALQYQYTLERSFSSRQGSITSSIQGSFPRPGLSRQSTLGNRVKKSSRIQLLRDEKERFEAMRKLQRKSQIWKNWWRLSLTLTVFAIFWCVGAVAFWKAEQSTLNMTYWETVYFCWVALLSIGYGDFAPKSGAGRCFFVIWSLIAVPTITILASDLTATIISVFNHWSTRLADFTILPQYGVWSNLVEKHPWLSLGLGKWKANWQAKHVDLKNRVETLEGIVIGTEKGLNGDGSVPDGLKEKSKDTETAANLFSPDINDQITQSEADVPVREPDAAILARQLAFAIRRTAHDLSMDKPRQYKFEEWVEFTRLIRFSAVGGVAEALREEEEEGLVEWDWIGEDSPMMAQQSESEFLLDRLVESLVRYLRRNPPVDAFAGSVKERGEEALRLRTGADESFGARSIMSGLIRQESLGGKSRKGSVSGIGPSDDDGGKAALHPVEEEDHEYHP